MPPTPFDDPQYQKSSFEATISGQPKRFDIYQRGEGRPLVLIQELPGIDQHTLEFADKLVAAGFSITVPHLFGPIGKTAMGSNLLRVFCMRREFLLFKAGKTSPVVEWLAALCRHVKEQSGAEGVGVIGMCLTGSFAISLMADDSVLAGVSAQPSLPLGKHDALPISEREISQIKDKVRDQGLEPIRAYRFEKDTLCRSEKFKALDEHFNTETTKCMELVELPGEGHAVFTSHFDKAHKDPLLQPFNEIVDYFNRQL